MKTFELWAAIRDGGSVNLVKRLLDQGAKFHTGNESALHYAASYGRLRITKLLLDRGADIHAKNDAALWNAAEKGHIKIVKLLLDRGADIHANYDQALTNAARTGRLRTVKLLLNRGANAHAFDDQALVCAIEHGLFSTNCEYSQVINLLIERGANVRAHSAKLFRWAMCKNDVGMMVRLVEHGAEYEILPEFKGMKREQVVEQLVAKAVVQEMVT